MNPYKLSSSHISSRLLHVARQSAQWVLAATLLVAVPVSAGSLEQAKRIHERLTGVPPSESILLQMKDSIDDDGNGLAAAGIAMNNDAFYRVTLKNWAAPWTNRDQTVFVPLNDYIATVMGMVRDGIDFRQVLYGDIIYVGNGVSPAYAANNNTHYETLETGADGSGQPFVFQDVLQNRTQSSVTILEADQTAGVMTSRAAAKAFFIAGTNRAQLRFTLMNHLCLDLEQLHDITRAPDRIRQDVSRSPGGDARAFLNGCIGCHSGMDPLAQAFAYYDYSYEPEDDLTGENGMISYNGVGQLNETTMSDATRVKPKYHFNNTTFPYGFVTSDDKWDNYWRDGINERLGWDTSLPGDGGGFGAKSMGQELAHSQAFAQCQAKKVFHAVCLREPADQNDRDRVDAMVSNFSATGFRMKDAFADAADYCKGE